jgi:hypothetical protein
MAKNTEAAIDPLAENETLREQLRQRTDELSAANVTIKKLEAKLGGKKYVDMTGQVPFEAKWKDPAGNEVSRKVEFKVPTVALPDGNATKVSTVGLSKLANGQELSESEAQGLEKYDQARAAELINRWAKIGAGVLKDAE